MRLLPARPAGPVRPAARRGRLPPRGQPGGRPPGRRALRPAAPRRPGRGLRDPGRALPGQRARGPPLPREAPRRPEALGEDPRALLAPLAGRGRQPAAREADLRRREARGGATARGCGPQPGGGGGPDGVVAAGLPGDGLGRRRPRRRRDGEERGPQAHAGQVGAVADPRAPRAGPPGARPRLLAGGRQGRGGPGRHSRAHVGGHEDDPHGVAHGLRA
mmetsp:Transcript_47614/g.140673  ORF Transcript_47614/g.140673 Transcript_47614/m.140673 type:complete len:218 (-) Transcript_47614:24-677(-)